MYTTFGPSPKCFKRRNYRTEIWCAPQRRTHTKTVVTIGLVLTELCLRSVSECTKTEPEAPLWCKVQQEVITPLYMYALSDVG